MADARPDAPKGEIASIDTLGTRGTWAPVRVTDDQLRLYAAATRDEVRPDLLPAGLLPVLARAVYAQGRRMPPGGVMAGLGWSAHAPLLRGGPICGRAEVARLRTRRGRRRVDIAVQLASADGGGALADVRFDMIWPAGAV